MISVDLTPAQASNVISALEDRLVYLNSEHGRRDYGVDHPAVLEETREALAVIDHAAYEALARRREQ